MNLAPREDYLHIGSADDIKDNRDRRIYRALEIMPGFLAWSTLAAVIVFSYLTPVAMAFFIIGFDIYWLLKTIYLSVHMRASFDKMRQNMKKNWLSELDGKPWGDLYHLVILPFAAEPIPVVRQGLEALAKVNYPLDRLIVVLAAEERAGRPALEIARHMEKEFGNLFLKFLVTVHPAGLEGENPGKGSNEAWAGRKVKEEVIDPHRIPYENVITSVFDIDTVVPPDFFGCLTWNFLTAEKPLRSSFQPIPLYTNNIWEAPAFARVFAFSTTFWKMIQQARPEKLVTFSSQSISFRALVDVGFWQRTVVSEDSFIFWQCLLRYDGDWRTVPMFYPVYMDANVAPSFWQTLKNQYKQIRRWAWGVENNPYFLFGFLKNNRIPRKTKWSLSWFMVETTHSLPTNSFIIFLLGWLPLAVGGTEFTSTILAYNLPNITRWIMSIAMIGLVSSAIISILLLPPRPPNFGKYKYAWMVLQWFLFPINLIFFGALPALDAQTRLMLGGKWRLGFWVTPKTRKSEARSTKSETNLKF